MSKRIAFTIYETEQEQDLIKSFRTQLKQLQASINIEKEHNKINIPYTNSKQLEVLKLFKILYNKCIEKNQLNNLFNILNNLINKLK